jgi:hypothetical protein
MGVLGKLAGEEVHTNLNYLRCPKCYKPLTTNRGKNWHQCNEGSPKEKPALVN